MLSQNKLPFIYGENKLKPPTLVDIQEAAQNIVNKAIRTPLVKLTNNKKNVICDTKYLYI